MLEKIDPVPSNNCVIIRQNLFEQAFNEMKQVAVKYDANAKNISYLSGPQYKFI